jgi:hypothetical protein
MPGSNAVGLGSRNGLIWHILSAAIEIFSRVFPARREIREVSGSLLGSLTYGTRAGISARASLTAA